MLFESERILAQREGTTIEKKFEQDIRDIPQGIAGETKVREVKTRVNQSVWRCNEGKARPCFCINELKSSDYICDNPIFFCTFAKDYLQL